jgi:hypothetical protein
LLFVVDVDFCEPLPAAANATKKILVIQILVILRPAFFAGRRIYGLVGSIGDAGELQRSFVGSPPLRVRRRCLRMTGHERNAGQLAAKLSA